MKYLGLWSPGLRKVFEKFVKLSGPLSNILNVHSLIKGFTQLLYSVLHRISISSFSKRFLKIYKSDYMFSLSSYFGSRKVVRVIQEKLPMKNKHLLILWEEISTARRNVCKKLRKFMRTFFLCKFCINEFPSILH